MNLFGPPNVAKLEAKRNVKGLIKALGYEGPPKGGDVASAVMREAAKALGQIGDARAVEPLIAALDGWACKEAAKALGQIGDARAVEPLIAVLKDSDNYVRLEAADALGNIGDARAVEPLIAMLMNPELDPGALEHKTVVRALLMSGRMTIEQIDETIKPIVAQYRANMEAIVKIYDPKELKFKHKYESFKSLSIESLGEKMYDPQTTDEERKAICVAWGKIGTDQAKEDLGEVFFSMYHRSTDGALCQIHPDVRSVAADVLKRLGPPAPKSLISGIEGRYQDKGQGTIENLIVAIGGVSTEKRLADALEQTSSPQTRSRIEKISQEIQMDRFVFGRFFS